MPTTATSSPRSQAYLPEHDTEGLDLRIMSPVDATRFSVERIRRGEDTISVTGNVLRDYNTDLFPILELGTSAKMLSVVPLMNGGGLFETGAGGSAPKHVQQLVAENYLRWDSLGEFLALAESFRHEGAKGNARAQVLGDTLDRATETCSTRTSPRPGGSARSTTVAATSGWPATGPRSWLRRPWTPSWLRMFAPVAEQLVAQSEAIDAELIAVQGHPVDIGGYYRPDEAKAAAVMRPSGAFNAILASLGG